MDRPRPTKEQLAWQEAGFGMFLGDAREPAGRTMHRHARCAARRASDRVRPAVGARRWHAFPVATGSRLTIQLDNSDARLVEVTAFRAGHVQLPALEPQPDSVHPSRFDVDRDNGPTR